MVATVEGKPRLSKTTPAGPTPAEWHVRGPGAPGPTPGRETFVIGIFAEFDAASTAIRRLTSTLEHGADAGLVSQSDHAAGGSKHAFNAHWAGLRIQDDTLPRIEGSPQTSWLEQNLTQHVADGASVVIVRTNDPEQQRAISRALLDLGCDVLLAHDVTAPTSGTEGNHVHNPVIFR